MRKKDSQKRVKEKNISFRVKCEERTSGAELSGLIG